jgi:hypothetical protein
MSAEDEDKKRQGEAILQYVREKYPYPWEKQGHELSDPDDVIASEPTEQGKDLAGERRRPHRSPKLWWSAVAIALCAAAGSLLWGAFFLTSPEKGEGWTTWAFKGAFGVLIASYLIEPMIRHLQTGRPPIFHPRFRSIKATFQGVLIAVTVALLADAYRDGILKSFDSVGEWGATSILMGLITYAWLRAFGAPYVEAANRADWFAVLGVLGFSLIGVALDVNRFNQGLIPGVAWNDQVPAVPWIDQTVNQWAMRTVVWSSIGRLGIWILARASSGGPVRRLLLAAFATGVILEVAYGVGMYLYPSLATHYFNTTSAKALLHPVFITVLWCAGIWLATPRKLGQTQAPIANIGVARHPRIGHGMRLTILGIAVVVVAYSARFALSPIAYTDPRIEFFSSSEPSPDPYGLHNLLTSGLRVDASTKRYVHAIVTVFHAPGERPRTIPTMCGLADSKGKLLMEPRELLVEVPDKVVSGPRYYPKTSWIVSFGGPGYQWTPGLYRVDCKLPQGWVAASFTVRP